LSGELKGEGDIRLVDLGRAIETLRGRKKEGKEEPRNPIQTKQIAHIRGGLGLEEIDGVWGKFSEFRHTGTRNKDKDLLGRGFN